MDDFESYADNDAKGETILQTWIEGFGVTDRKSLKPAESLTCDGVTDSGWGNGFAHLSDADDDGDAEERAANMAEEDDFT